MVPAVIGTGVANVTVCQPLTDSLLKVAVASSVPPVVHSEPVCMPMFCGPL